MLDLLALAGAAMLLGGCGSKNGSKGKEERSSRRRPAPVEDDDEEDELMEAFIALSIIDGLPD